MKEVHDIAVIGISCVFPHSRNMEQYRNVLRNAVDTIGAPSHHRISLVGLSEDVKYMELGYLEDIDQFDYEFFHLSPREAALMDPQHRIALMEAARTIWDAGYSLDSFKGSETAFVMCCGDSHYDMLLERKDGLSTVGNLNSLIAGRIAYHLDLRGPAYLVDTSCSSSLFAIHQACGHIRNGDADYALAGGVAVNVLLYPEESVTDDTLGIASSSGRARTFDESSDGSGGGEGCGFVLLKDYDKAIAEKDHIYAVIKGSGVNHDGAGSNSIAAPSPTAQTEVIQKAWKDSGIDPETIGYIEAHGTGTKIGDPIEIKGLTDAFLAHTDKLGFAAISAVKTNIGHTGYSAGVASFIKAVLAVYYGEKYPLVHYKNPNKMIDFSSTAVYPCANYEPWEESNRNAVVSSFGLSGTNVHMVIENDKADEVVVDGQVAYPIVLSAETNEALLDYANQLKHWLKHASVPIQDIAYTLYTGREHFLNRLLLFSKSKEDLLNQLENIKIERNKTYEDCVILCSHDGRDTRNHVEHVVFQIDAYNYLKNIITSQITLMGCGNGNRVVEYLTGQCTLDAMKNSISDSDKFKLNERAFLEAIGKRYKKTVFIELSPDGVLSGLIKRMYQEAEILYYEDGLKENLICKLYQQGVKLELTSFFSSDAGRVHMPFCDFNTKNIWIKNPKLILNHGETVTVKNDLNPNTIAFIIELWKNVLGVDEITETSDFFENGGNSLMAMQIINRIREGKQIEIDFDDFYLYKTPVKLAALLVERAALSTHIKSKKQIDECEDEAAVLSHFQKSMLAIYKQHENSTAYNMPAEIVIRGGLNVEYFIRAFMAIIEKHEILCTVYKEINGEFTPKVVSDMDIIYEDITTAFDQENRILDTRVEFHHHVFQLEMHVPLRIKIYKISAEVFHVFILIHHIAADGWSVGIMLRELASNYRELKATGTLAEQIKVHYSEYAKRSVRLLNSEFGIVKIQFWQDYLSGVPKFLDFPTDRDRSAAMNHIGREYEFKISKELTHKVGNYAKKHEISEYSLLFCVYCLLLNRYSFQTDFCVGTPVANRRGIKEESMIGFFANTLAIRTKIDNAQSFSDYAASFHRQLLDSFKNQDVPFELIVSLLKLERSASYSPLFQYGFALQNLGNSLEIDELEFEFLTTKQRDSKFELLLSLSRNGDTYEGTIEYMTELFDHETIMDFAKNYMIFLGNAITDSEEEVSKISLIESGERDLQVMLSNSSSREEYEF